MANSPWLTAREASEYLKLTPATLRRAVKSGALKVYPINNGRHIRFRVEDLDRWLMGQAS